MQTQVKVIDTDAKMQTLREMRTQATARDLYADHDADTNADADTSQNHRYRRKDATHSH